MKKTSISSQLLLLFFSILLFTSCIFVVISYYSITRIAEKQVYLRLESYSTIINFDRFGDRPTRLPDMDVGYISKNGDSVKKNDPYNTSIITDEEFNVLLEEILEERSKAEYHFPNYMAKGHYKTTSGKVIYYFIQVEDNMENYSFVYTDSSFTNSLVKQLLLRTFSAFVGIVFLAVAFIYAWSTRLTYRIRLIQNHIVNLPKNKYEKSYVDDKGDEIGDLSRSVESMRIEIGTNEKTKQEMLQNLSHDFKTPIAVIKSYAEAIQDGVTGPEALDVIIEQAEVLKKKVNRLLQYNSLEYLTKDKPFEPVYMKELINSVVSNYKYQTNLEFNLDLEEEVSFQGYVENWKTVVENIIDNAMRYAKKEIKIILRPNRLRIYNDGEPIDPQFLEGIFKPYEKGSKGQFGLGMSIVKKTIDFFGMNLNVQNEDYGGVSFIISNPNTD